MQQALFQNGNGGKTMRSGCIFDDATRRWITPEDIGRYLQAQAAVYEQQTERKIAEHRRRIAAARRARK